MVENDNLCRMCLQFEDNCEQTPLAINLINALKDIFKIRIFDSNQNLPRHVCSECTNKISEFYTFYLDAMTNQAKLLIGLDKFVIKQVPKIPEPHSSEPSHTTHKRFVVGEIEDESFDSVVRLEYETDETPSDITSPIPVLDDQQLEVYKRIKTENEQQTDLINAAAEVNETESICVVSDDDENDESQKEQESIFNSTLPDITLNSNFVPSKQRLIDSFEESHVTDSQSYAYSQETIVSDDITNDPTYTPPASLLGKDDQVSSESDDDEVVIKKRNSPIRPIYDSDDSDVQITGVISSLNNTIKRKLAQPSITDFFVTKKEKVEPDHDK